MDGLTFKMKNTNQQGYTLIEIVVVIVFLSILMVISVPLLQKAIMRANDGSAIAAMRVVGQAENNVFISTGKYLTLEELKNKSHVDELVGSGTKSGYNFQLTLINSSPEPNYLFSAKPISPSGITKSGSHRLGISKDSVIYEDTTNLTDFFTTIAELTVAPVRPIGD